MSSEIKGRFRECRGRGGASGLANGTVYGHGHGEEERQHAEQLRGGGNDRRAAVAYEAPGSVDWPGAVGGAEAGEEALAGLAVEEGVLELGQLFKDEFEDDRITEHFERGVGGDEDNVEVADEDEVGDEEVEDAVHSVKGEDPRVPHILHLT